MNNISEKDLIWLAGFIDGEGCIKIDKQYRLTINIGQTNEKILEYVQNIVGYGSICPHKHDLKYGWIYTICANQALELLEPLLPYFRHPNKILEAKIAIQFQKNKTHLRKEDCDVEKELKWREMHYQLLRYIKRIHRV